MSTVPDLVERHPGFVDLAIRRKSDVAAYQLSAANTLDAAFTAPTAMVTVPAGAMFQSRTVRNRGLGRTQESQRGLTRIHYNPEDFWTIGTNLPHDDDISYLRVEEVSNGGVVRPAGPILVIPSHGFWMAAQPAIQLQGTAPDVAASITGVPPAGAMHVVIPRHATSVVIRNNSAPDLLYVSFDRNMPEQEFPNNYADSFTDGTVMEFYLRGQGSTPRFNIYLAVVNGSLA